MEGFALILAHLIGDYILQDDAQAQHKMLQHPGPFVPPEPESDDSYPSASGGPSGRYEWRYGKAESEWAEKVKKYQWAGYYCTLHCSLYTMAFFACCFWFLPWWAYPVIFLTHWPVDRYRLAYKFMMLYGRQKEFATGMFSPWSVIVVDNTFHLIVAYLVGFFALYPRSWMV